jgi:hypothetical protein
MHTNASVVASVKHFREQKNRFFLLPIWCAARCIFLPQPSHATLLPVRIAKPEQTREQYLRFSHEG